MWSPTSFWDENVNWKLWITVSFCKFSWPYHKVPPLKSVWKISDTSLNFTLSRQIPNCHFSRIKVQFLKIKWTHKSFNGKLTKYTVWAYLNLKFICINISGYKTIQFPESMASSNLTFLVKAKSDLIALVRLYLFSNCYTLLPIYLEFLLDFWDSKYRLARMHCGNRKGFNMFWNFWKRYTEKGVDVFVFNFHWFSQ